MRRNTETPSRSFSARRGLAITALVLAGATALATTSCVGGSKDISAKDKERLKSKILDKAPAKIPVKLDTNFDGKVKLLGYEISTKGPVKPGEKVKLTMYWRSEKKLEDGWNLFTHVLDASGERILNIDNVGPLREWRGKMQLLGPSRWEPGKVYVDEQEFTVPPKVKTKSIQVVTGVWKGNQRLKITRGRKDRENRAMVATIATTAKSPKKEVNTRVPQVRVDKLEKGTKLKIDGKLDEDAWKTAPVAGPFVDVGTGKKNTKFPVNGSVKILWDDANLYLGFDVKDPDIVGGFDNKKKDPHLWTKDTVEIMVDPDGDGDNKDYYEIQINPQNLVFDTRFDEYNKPKKDPDGPFGHQDWSAKLTSAVTVNGTLDKEGDKDEGYVIEVKIPWKSFDKAKHAPPEIGDRWRMNFYAMQKNSGVAWSPILGQGNFHKASRFGRVLFAEKGWKPKPKPVQPAGSALQLPVAPGKLPKLKLPKGHGPSPVESKKK